MSDDGRGVMDAGVIERMRKEMGSTIPLHVRFAQVRRASSPSRDLGISFRTREPVTN